MADPRAKEAPPLVWHELSDPTTDKLFYANPHTGQCSWTKPPGRIIQDELPDWWELWDSDLQRVYYYNNKTKETVWNFSVCSVYPIPLSLDDDKKIRNALEAGYRPYKPLAPAWIENRNQETGQLFYYNSELNISTWFREEAEVGGGNEAEADDDSETVSDSDDLTDLQMAAMELQKPFLPIKMEPTEPPPSLTKNSSDAKNSPTKKPPMNSQSTDLGSSTSPVIVKKWTTVISPSNERRFERSLSARPARATPKPSPRAVLAKSPTAVTTTTTKQEFDLPTPQHIEQFQPVSSDLHKFQLEGFAQQYFAQRKKGLFSKAYVPLSIMIQWQKHAISGSLLRKGIRDKVAVANFKRIQRYMGERGRDAGDPLQAQHIVSLGIRKLFSRDEIYCQLCKQITNNPVAESKYRGFDLLALCLQHFPPSTGLNKWITAFIDDFTKDPDPKVVTYHKYCSRRLRKIAAEGGSGIVPTVPQIVDLLEYPFRKAVFGGSLEDIMAMQSEQGITGPTDPNGNPTKDLPHVLVFLMTYIEKTGGLQTEGIFRISGDPMKILTLRLQVESGDYTTFSVSDPHTPSSVLKLWFRELEYPIVPEELYDSAINSTKDGEPSLSCKLVDSLQPTSRHVVKWTIAYLRRVCSEENVQKNRMTASNLAMIFAPNLLRCPSQDPVVIMSTQKYQQKFVENLIQKLDTNP